MREDLHNDQEYLDALKREVYYDVVKGVVTLEDIDPILSGAEEYLRLRRQVIARIRRWRNRALTLYYTIKYRLKPGVLTINGKTLSIDQIIDEFARRDYVCDSGIAAPVYLSLLLQKPLLIEGEPGVGKTEIAKVLSAMLDAELIRLQCYEGLDETRALYEWNYQKQLLYIQGKEHTVEDVFSDEFIMVRPLMKAILAEETPPVLLIDEIDKADEEFEAFLLEILSDFQISIPEFGTVKAKTIPHIIITNNDTRELTPALKRRCIYLYIDYPTEEKEQKILLKKVPGIQAATAGQIAHLMNTLRTKVDLIKKPSIAEGIDFARAATIEGINDVDAQVIDRFLSTLLKNKEDMAMVNKRGGGRWLVGI